jgi:antitoxin FitA
MQNADMADSAPDSTTTLTVRHVPSGVHRELQSRAAAAHQSLQEYLLAQLRRLASQPTLAEVLARAEANKQGSRVTTDDLLRFHDEDRASR